MYYQDLLKLGNLFGILVSILTNDDNQLISTKSLLAYINEYCAFLIITEVCLHLSNEMTDS